MSMNYHMGETKKKKTTEKCEIAATCAVSADGAVAAHPAAAGVAVDERGRRGVPFLSEQKKTQKII
jgi:hypothetical protein